MKEKDRLSTLKDLSGVAGEISLLDLRGFYLTARIILLLIVAGIVCVLD